MTDIRCPLARQREQNPDRPALKSGDRLVTYGALENAVQAQAIRLSALPSGRDLPRLGLRARDRREAMSFEYVLRLLVILRSGRIVVPMDGGIPESTVEKAVPDLTDLSELLDVKWDSDLPEEVNTQDCSWGLGVPAVGMLTSGSSSIPKLCMLSYGNLYYSALGVVKHLDMKPGDRTLLSLPVYHVGGLGMVIRVLVTGGTLVFPEPSRSPAEIIGEEKINHCSMVPTQLDRYLTDGGQRHDLKSLLLGGGPLPEALIGRAVEKDIPVAPSYGLTEMASTVAAVSPGEIDVNRLCSAGSVLKHRKVRVADDGEILVRGETLCMGYVIVDSIKPVVDDDGWFHTGDLGEFRDGQLYVTGRKDNMFVSGGENVQPESIERVLASLDGISEAVVVPVDDDRYGARPFAFVAFDDRDPRDFGGLTRAIRDYVLLTKGQAPLPVQVRRELKGKLPDYAVPVHIAEIPTGAREGIKVRRSLLVRYADERYVSRDDKPI